MSHHRVRSRSWTATVTLLSLASLFVPLAHAKSKEKDKKQQQPTAAGIYLISHLPLPETTVSNIVAASSDPTRQLLQLTDTVRRTVTVVDVTEPTQPKLLEHSQLPAEFANASMQTRVGDTALFTAADSDSGHGDSRSVTLVSFADTSNPKTVQKFEGVTAVWSDRERELIYLTNAEGLWILQVYSAADKRAEEQFDEMLRGSR
jgi:hypothetical protein